MTKKKAVKKEVKEVVDCPVVVTGKSTEWSEKEIEKLNMEKETPVVNIQIPASVVITNLKVKLQDIPGGFREIDLAVEDACLALDRALALCNFIEAAQADLLKKKR